MRNILHSIELDYDITKSRFLFFLLGYVLGVFFSVLTKTPFLLIFIVMAIAAPVTGQCFQVYEKNNLDKLYGVLPLKKTEVVVGRYLYALSIVILNGVVALVLAYILAYVTHSGANGFQALTFLSLGFFYFCLTVAVIFPLYFKFPFSKVYILSNLPFYLIVILSMLVARRMNAFQQAGPVMQYLNTNLIIAAIGFGLGLILLAASCLLSCALREGNRAVSLTEEKAGKRLFFVDSLRAWMVILVVIQHVAAIYSTLYLFMMLNSAYFMGLLFLLSGYFTPGSFERKGPAAFLKDRLIRLGIPTLVYFFLLNPIASWTYRTAKSSDSAAAGSFALGPLWFAVMLLVFDLGYLAWRTLTKNSPERPVGAEHGKLSFRAVTFFTLALAAITYLLRIVVPYGIFILEFPSLGYLPQYLSFFIIGIVAFRNDLLRSVSGSLGQIGFILAVLASVIFLPAALIGPPAAFIGHGSLQSAFFALWDSIFAVGMSLALITFCRRFLNKGKKFGRFLSDHSFTVYIIHVPIISFVILAMSGLQTQQPLKSLLAAAIGLPLCFGAAYLVRLIPFVKKVI